MFATFVLCKLPVGRYENIKRKLLMDNWNFFNNFELVVRNWDRDERVFKIEYVCRWCGIQFSLPHLPPTKLPKLQMKIRCHWAYLCSSNSAMEVLSVLFSLFFKTQYLFVQISSDEIIHGCWNIYRWLLFQYWCRYFHTHITAT